MIHIGFDRDKKRQRYLSYTKNMNRSRRAGAGLVLSLGLSLLLAAPALAHHGRGAYDLHKHVTVTGSVIEFQYINPHSHIRFHATDPDVREWVADSGPPDWLLQCGIKSDLLKPGDQMVAIGYPAKDGDPQLLLSELRVGGKSYYPLEHEQPSGLEFVLWLENSAVGAAVRDSSWLFPFLSVLHLYGMVLIVGLTTALDLRLMGFLLMDQPVSQILRRVLPAAWLGFALMVVTGTLLSSSEAIRLSGNTAFRIKLSLLFLAGVTAAVFQFTSRRTIASWDRAAAPPIGARLTGFLSLLLWFGILAAGRWIGFTRS